MTQKSPLRTSKLVCLKRNCSPEPHKPWQKEGSQKTKASVTLSPTCRTPFKLQASAMKHASTRLLILNSLTLGLQKYSSLSSTQNLQGKRACYDRARACLSLILKLQALFDTTGPGIIYRHQHPQTIGIILYTWSPRLKALQKGNCFEPLEFPKPATHLAFPRLYRAP